MCPLCGFMGLSVPQGSRCVNRLTLTRIHTHIWTECVSMFLVFLVQGTDEMDQKQLYRTLCEFIPQNEKGPNTFLLIYK